MNRAVTRDDGNGQLNTDSSRTGSNLTATVTLQGSPLHGGGGPERLEKDDDDQRQTIPLTCQMDPWGMPVFR